MVEEFYSSDAISMPRVKPGRPLRVSGAAVAGTAAGMGAIRSLDADNNFLSTLNFGNTVGNTTLGAEFMLIPGAAWLGRQTLGRLPYVGGRINNGIGYGLKAPLAALQKTTVGDVLDGTGAWGRNFGAEAQNFSALHGTLKGTSAGQAILAASANTTPVVSNAASMATSGAFNMEHAVSRFYGARARSGLLSLERQAGGFMDNLRLGQSGMIGGLGKRLMRDLRLSKELPAVATLPSEVQAVHGALEQLQAATKGPAHLVDMDHVRQCIGKVRDTAKLANDAGHGKMVGSLINGVPEMERHVTMVGGQMNAARSTQGTMATLGKAAKGMPLIDVAFKGGLAVGTAYYSLRTIGHASQAITYLKEMNKDLTGHSISTWQLLTGSGLSPMMGEARANLFARFGPEAITDAAGALLNITFMNRNLGPSGMVAMIGAMGLQSAAGALAPKQHLLDSYITIKDMKSNHMHVPAEAYAALLDAASADARKIGGEKSRLVQGLAMEYETAQTSPADLLKEIEGKTAFMDRSKRVAEAIAAEDKLHPMKAPKTDKSLIADAQVPSHKINTAHRDPIKEKQAATGIPTTLSAAHIEHEGKLHQQHKQVGA